MRTLSLDLSEQDIRILEQAARRRGMTVEDIVAELAASVARESQAEEDLPDPTQDPVFNMRAHESGAPSDLSERADRYLYGVENE